MKTTRVALEADFTASGEWSNSKHVGVTATLSYEGDPSTNSWQLVLNEQVVDILPASGEYWIDCGVSSLCPGE